MFMVLLQVYWALDQCKGRPLIENVPHDNFWGCGYDGKGQNMLGKMLMQLQQAPPPITSRHQSWQRPTVEEHDIYQTGSRQADSRQAGSRQEEQSPPHNHSSSGDKWQSVNTDLRHNYADPDNSRIPPLLPNFISPQKPRALLIGNSHLRTINPWLLTPMYQVEKFMAYTV